MNQKANFAVQGPGTSQTRTNIFNYCLDIITFLVNNNYTIINIGNNFNFSN